jgi:hypothetical protein
MLAFLLLLERKYGGVRAYLKDYLGFLEEDIDRIRENLLEDATEA